ncbi:MAG: hypothetical protein IMF10_02690 [Proteobacteria bacterium]|jgi:hypothetical protein|nr:hypothetical protein [Pseudomonadota bacterium]
MILNIKNRDRATARFIRRFLDGISINPFFFHIAVVMLLSLSTQVWANPASVSKNAAASERSVAGNARMRIVWVQDMGDGRDVFAQGTSLRLMGLDTGDGQGERVICGTPRNYAKPLITPPGNRVVFTDRSLKKIYVVNWDGSGLRELFGGVGLVLWRDPQDGREWMYYGPEEGEKGAEYCPVVYRTLLDSPGAGELIWNRTRVSVNSFQLSEDGRMAGGLFPWPDGGVAQLPNRSMKLYAKGCWTSITSVQGKYFFWIFDGAHRNLTLVNQENERKWQVRINGAPGIDGHEVYHPRWSNHHRIMTMTGPYKVGLGANRIAGGGPAVEIYVGRFNAGLTKIESWWRVTTNDQADFFPDVWVASAEGAKQNPVKVSSSKKAKTVPAFADPGKAIAPRKTIKRVVVEARLTDLSGVPTPQDIAPYKCALLVNGYEVVRVVSGSYRRKKIMAAHWVIEDGRVHRDAKREKGKIYRMVLERYDDHPELEGERLIMDSDEFKLRLYYELRN